MLSERDLQILEKLQQFPPKSQTSDQSKGKKSPAPITHAEITREINQSAQEEEHISESTVTRCIETLAKDGVFTGYAAILDAKKLGLRHLAMVSISLSPYTRPEFDDFVGKLKALEAVQVVLLVAGKGIDILLFVITSDGEACHKV